MLLFPSALSPVVDKEVVEEFAMDEVLSLAGYKPDREGSAQAGVGGGVSWSPR